jgi:hypothetical protein
MLGRRDSGRDSNSDDLESVINDENLYLKSVTTGYIRPIYTYYRDRKVCIEINCVALAGGYLPIICLLPWGSRLVTSLERCEITV